MSVREDVSSYPGTGATAIGLGRLLPVSPQPPADLGRHLHLHGPLPRLHSPALIAAVAEAGLTGRGGAAFPTSRKLEAVRAASEPPAVVANGAESEPASAKDKTLLLLAPHLVLDGLQLAAVAVGARSAYLYVHRNPELLKTLRGAIAERSRRRMDNVTVRLVEAPARFLAGEKSALANRISGGSALPRFSRPPVSQRGVGGAPTLVQNAETLAHLALIARHGPAWFRELGTPDEPGSLLCTVHVAGRPVQVIETEAGTPLRPVGAWVGAGILAALPGRCCGLAESASVVRYLALESAGQCGPCLNALPRIAGAMAALADLRPPPHMRANLLRWAGLAEGRGACHHPDGTVKFVRSALVVFAHEEQSHCSGRCSATDTRQFLPVPSVPPGNRDWK